MPVRSLRPLWALAVPLGALWADPALAAVSAEDVWAATEAYWEAFGLEVDATLHRDGQTLTALGISATASLPFGIGALAATAPDLAMTELDDGTVRIEAPSPAAVSFDLRLWTGEAVQVPLTVAWTDRVQVASGAPGDVTFDLQAGRLDVSLGEIAARGGSGRPIPRLELDISLASLDVSTRVTLGETVAIRSTASYGAVLYGYAAESGPGTRTQVVGQTEPSSGTMTLVLPVGGTDLLDLPAALRAGLSAEIDSYAEGSLTQTVTTAVGAVVAQETQRTGEGRQSLRIDVGGFATSGRVLDSGFSIQDGYGILGVEGEAAQASWEVAFPLLAGAGRQPFGLNLAFDELRFTPRTWNLLDATGAVPRDPASLDIALGGEVTLPFDLLDPRAWEAMEASPELPLDLDSFAVERLKLEGLGILADGRGAFTFDNADLSTFPGIPRPEGQGSLTLQGAQALLDRLTRAGVLTPEDARNARLGLAFAFRAVGPDRSTSVLEVTPEGHVLLNGQRMR